MIDLAFLRRLATDPEATIRGTPMVPLAQATLCEICAELEAARAGAPMLPPTAEAERIRAARVCVDSARRMFDDLTSSINKVSRRALRLGDALDELDNL